MENECWENKKKIKKIKLAYSPRKRKVQIMLKEKTLSRLDKLTKVLKISRSNIIEEIISHTFDNCINDMYPMRCTDCGEIVDVRDVQCKKCFNLQGDK